MATRSPRYFVLNRHLITVSDLPPNIDTSEDEDVHQNLDILLAVYHEIEQRLHNQVTQEINILRTDLQQCQERLSDLTEENDRLKKYLQRCLERINNLTEEVQKQLVNNSCVQKHIKENELLKEINSQQRKEIERLVSDKKDLQAEIATLKCTLGEYTDTFETKNLTAKHSSRFEVVRLRFECTRCKQAFDSREEMKSSVCRYHKAHPCPTGKRGCFYYKCCQLESDGKPSLGCTQGKHVCDM